MKAPTNRSAHASDKIKSVSEEIKSKRLEVQQILKNPNAGHHSQEQQIRMIRLSREIGQMSSQLRELKQSPEEAAVRARALVCQK